MVQSSPHRDYCGTVESDLHKRINKSYDKVIINYISEKGKKRIQELDGKPIIYVLPHLSHFDYIVGLLGIYGEELPYPRPVGGANMFEGKTGEAFTRYTGIDGIKAGGISVKRNPNLRDNAILCKDLQKLLKQCYNLFIFPGVNENGKTGRSYSGEMIDFASLVFQSAIRAAGNGKEVFIVPTAISYDFVAEDKYFPEFLKGERLKELEVDFFENMFSLGKGNIYLDFGEPITVDGKEDKKELAKRCQLATAKTYSVTGTNLVASALDKGAAMRSGLQISVEDDIYDLRENNANLRNIGDDIEFVIDKSLVAMEERGLISNGKRISVKRPDITKYYYNTIKHLLK
jgi:glycerol-3-phosphate O-acyltransferase